MTQAVGAHSSYDEPIATGGNREDLSDIIKDVSPAETPLLTMLRRTDATGTNHEWNTDALEDAASNAHIEGDDMTGADPASRGRLGNYTQILSKNSVVTGTQEKVKKGGGIKSEMAYQMARRMRAIKKDAELAIIGLSNAKAAGNDTTAREMGSLDSYLLTNNQLAAGSSAPTGDGSDVSDYAGTDRDLSQTIFDAALQSIWDNSGGNEAVNALCTSGSKKVISTFTQTNTTRNVSTDDKKLVTAIDVYEGDFHIVKIVPSRQCIDGNVFVVDPEYMALSELRKMFSQDIARLGDSQRKQILWECTLEVNDERAHSSIGDLNT